MSFDQNSPALSMDLYELAMLPMIRLSPDAEPSEIYCGSDLSKLDPAYHDVVNTGLWSYQLYTYLDLLERLFGQDIKIEVRDWLLDMLNANDFAGDRLVTVFSVIENAMHASHSIMDTGSGLSCVPVEMSIALAMLLDLPESPDLAVSAGDRRTRIRLINADVDQYFAASLKCARNDVFSTLLPILEGLGAVIPDNMQAQAT